MDGTVARRTILRAGAIAPLAAGGLLAAILTPRKPIQLRVPALGDTGHLQDHKDLAELVNELVQQMNQR